ncbi:MAG: sigma-70 family RNA polymerase sigma factor [Firmicutes bacterium]|nr:sigma-70 family RNA polymerase sigma factor [Bacillota bacterium]
MREREIAGLLRDKHPDGMQQLLLHYGPLIRYIIAPIVPDAHDREDCFSEVMLRIWEKADRFAPQRGSWKAWLTAVTRNTAYNFVRQTARCGEGELPEHAPSPAPDPEEALLWAERRRALQRALAQLSTAEQALFYRKYYYLLQVSGLQYILPTVGLVLLLLGFRALRRENRWFCAGFRLCGAWFACAAAGLALRAAIAPETASSWLGYAAAALFFWYVLLVALTFARPNVGWLFAAVILAAYLCVLRSLFRLTRVLDEIGYAVRPAAVRVPDGWLAAGLTAWLAACIACGYLFVGSYAMDWTALPPQGAYAEERSQLAALGFPEDVFADLSEDDLAACRGALRVVSRSEDVPMNDGRTVKKGFGQHTWTDIVYDTRELRVTGVAVQIAEASDGGGEWIVFYHFRWLENPGFYGTEALRVLPTSDEPVDWGDWTGRVLYDRGGAANAAPYASLGNVTAAYSSFGTLVTQTNGIAAFSLPNRGENQRGYVACRVRTPAETPYLRIQMDYVHQKTWLQYPVEPSAEAYSHNRADGRVLCVSQWVFSFSIP